MTEEEWIKCTVNIIKQRDHLLGMVLGLIKNPELKISPTIKIPSALS